MEYFKYLGNMLTSDGRCPCEIKSWIAMAKAAFNKKKTLFTSTLDLNLRKKLVNGAWLCMVLKLGRFSSRSEIPGKFLNVVLEKDGEDQLDRSWGK